MANYYGHARTNYFAVKDGKAFEEELSRYAVEVIKRDTEEGVTLYGFMDDNPDGGGLDWCYWDDELDTDMEIDWTDILARHLADGAVAIIMETGHEKYRYLQGWAMAVNSKGETREVNLARDIDTLAKELGENVTVVGW